MRSTLLTKERCRMNSEALEERVRRDLDTIRGILTPLDEDGREGMLATIIVWWTAYHQDRVAAITRLCDRIAEIEEDITKEKMQ